MNKQELRIKIQESMQVTKSLEEELRKLNQEKYTKELLALKGKCYAGKIFSEDSKYSTFYKIIDCSPEHSSSDLKVVAVTSFSDESYSIERINYSGKWFEDNDVTATTFKSEEECSGEQSIIL
jgi:hypothetical protein